MSNVEMIVKGNLARKTLFKLINSQKNAAKYIEIKGVSGAIFETLSGIKTPAKSFPVFAIEYPESEMSLSS